MEKEKLRAVGYRRVSMKEQVDGHSLDAQEKNIRDYAKHNDWELIEIYTDAGISAKKDSHRPALAKLMQDAEAGKFDVVIVDKVDRFYRHLAGLLTAPRMGVNPDMGGDILIFALVTVVIGGMGSFWGAVLAGLLIGVTQSLTTLVMPQMAQLVVFILMGLVLYLLPRGLLGSD